MSIQGTLNAVISMGGVLATQTSAYEKNKAIAGARRTIEKTDKLAGHTDELTDTALDMIKKERKEATLTGFKYGDPEAYARVMVERSNAQAFGEKQAELQSTDATGKEAEKFEERKKEFERKHLDSYLYSDSDIDRFRQNKEDEIKKSNKLPPYKPDQIIEKAKRAKAYTRAKQNEKRISNGMNPYRLEVMY